MLFIIFNILICILLFYISVSSNLEFQIKTFFSLFLTTLIISGYIFSFNFLIKLENPMYMDQISIYTLVRYIAFILIICLGFIYIFSKKYISFFSHKFEFLSSSFIYENLRVFINNINPNLLIKIANIIMHDIRYNDLKKNIYIGIFIIIKVLIPFLTTCIFLNFAFFHGDLRYMIYLIPFNFIKFLLSFYIYWLDLYSKKNMEFGHKILNVNLNSNIDSTTKVISITKDSLDISLTTFGFSIGYQTNQIPLLSENFITIAHFRHILRKYAEITFPITTAFLMVNFFSYIFIVNSFYA